MAQEPKTDGVFIGVDLGSQVIRICTADRDGKLVSFREEAWKTLPEEAGDGRPIVDQVIAAIRQEIAPAASIVAGIGIGLPGLVHYPSNRIVSLPHMGALQGIDLHGEVSAAFGLPVDLENNSNAAAVAEAKRGVGRGVSDWLYLHIGRGVGAGLFLDSRLRRGKSGFAGEIGHVNVDPEGLDCSCGSTGCLETVASAPNIVRRTSERLRRDSTSSLSRLGIMRNRGFTLDDIVSAANDGDELAKMMLKRTGSVIGLVVADMINALNLSLVAIGGSPGARPLLVPAINAEARRRAFGPIFEDCQVVAAELGSEATVIGAALLASAASAPVK